MDYTKQSIDPNILSVLDVDATGKVVSAEDWKELWGLVIKHINTIDEYCLSIEDIRVNWEASEAELNKVITEFRAKYDILSKSFIHYGEEPPKDEHIKLWVQPVEDVSGNSFVTKDMLRSLTDQTYNPTSENAQSGKAVAEAIDPRTAYQKFIDDNNLKQRKWVDLSFVGGEYYYTDFLQAVADVNADTTVNSTTDSTNAVCQIFKNEDITVLRLLSDISVTTKVIFEKSVIFDINGYEISLSGNGVFGTSGLIPSEFKKNTVVFYGAKMGSKITATDCITILGIINQYFYILGGIIELNLTETFSKSAYEITYVVNYDEDTLFEIINTNIYLNDNRASGNKSTGIFFAISDIKNHIVNIFNSKIYTYSTATATNAINVSKHVSITQSHLLGTFKNTEIMSISPADKGDNASIAVLTNQNAGTLRLYNCYVEGMTSGIQNKAILYLTNCICKSPAHGGLYNATYGIAYLQNSKFHRNEAIDGYIPNATSASYFGYSSTAYLNNCSFILDTEGDTSDGIAIKQGNTTEPTYVYMSNCELPKLRCDSGQYVYLGEGISDEIKNTTVSGTKVLTEENYSTYINKEMSQPIVDIEYEPTSRSPQSGIAVAAAVVEAKDYTDTKIGDIDTALDNIITLQNSYIGGNS